MALKITWRHGVAHISGTIRPRAGGQSIRVRESTNTADPRLAEAYRAKREAELFEAAIFGRRDPVAFRSAALSYLDFEERSQRTIDYVTRLADYFGVTLVDAIGQDEADAAVRSLLAPTAKPSTRVREVYTPLIAVLTFAAQRRWCAPPNIAKPKIAAVTPRWLTPTEAEALIEGAATHLKPLIAFLLGTGARLSEALDLEWADVDLPAGHVMLRGTKNGHDRRARLTPSAYSAVASMPHRDGKVFRRDDGAPYTDRERWEGGQIKTAWATACMRAQVRNATPHDLRHTFATWFYALSKDLLLLKDEGGWRTLAIVERYAHLMPSELAPQIARVWGGNHPRISPRISLPAERSGGA